MSSAADSVLKRVQVHGRGQVLTPRSFLTLGTRRAVDRALARLGQDKTIRRLAQGIYDYPRVHKKLGIVAVNPDDVAAVVAAKSAVRIQVPGARAANLLGRNSVRYPFPARWKRYLTPFAPPVCPDSPRERAKSF
jgi:hypothetical protein